MMSAMRHFIHHYVEMVLAMAVGMAVYGMLFRRGLAWTGYADEAIMAAFMTVPMVAWMRYRGHGWGQAGEMAGAMLLPTAVVIVVAVELLAVTGRPLGMASHAAMLLGMLALMVVRRAEYAHGTHGTHGTHGVHAEHSGHAAHTPHAAHAH
jgi:flagellar biosynthetic protein FliP